MTLDEAVAAAAAGTWPPPVAAMHIVLASRTRAEAETVLATMPRLVPCLDRLRAHPGLWDRVREVFALAEASDGDGVDRWRAAFDAAARQSPALASALYALGDADMMRQATDEIVHQLKSWNVLPPSAFIVDLGCGSGRLLAALRGHRAVGVDISHDMLRAARPVSPMLVRGTGRDLAFLPDASVDLVVAVDSFPYVVRAGSDVVAGLMREITRILRGRGALAVFNYAYGSGIDDERAALASAGESAGLRMAAAESGGFSTWDGRAFLLRPTAA